MAHCQRWNKLAPRSPFPRLSRCLGCGSIERDLCEVYGYNGQVTARRHDDVPDQMTCGSTIGSSIIMENDMFLLSTLRVSSGQSLADENNCITISRFKIYRRKYQQRLVARAFELRSPVLPAFIVSSPLEYWSAFGARRSSHNRYSPVIRGRFFDLQHHHRSRYRWRPPRVP